MTSRRLLGACPPPSGVLFFALGVALVMPACATEQGYDYGAVCANHNTLLRVDDYRCDHDGEFGWLYFPMGADVPMMGQRPAPGVATFTSPTGGSYRVQRGGVDTSGGTMSKNGVTVKAVPKGQTDLSPPVQRGGLGATSKGGSNGS